MCVTFFTFSSDDSPKFSPSGQLVMISKIPVQLGFPIQACCVVRAAQLVHSGMMCCREFPFEYPAQCWQLGHQEEPYFGVNHL